MQMTKFKSLFNLVSNNRKCIRTVASTAVNSDANLKSWREIPGPSSLPIIGQMLSFMPGDMYTRHELGHLCATRTLSENEDSMRCVNCGVDVMHRKRHTAAYLIIINNPAMDCSSSRHLHKVEIIEHTMKLFELYGPIVRFDAMFGKGPMILLGDPECTALILRSENLLPVRRGFQSLEYYRKEYKKSKGHTIRITGLATDHGELWREFRSTVNPVLLQPKTIKLYSTVLDEVAQDMIARMKANRDEKNMISNNFDKEMNLWALESIGTVALGCRLNCFDPNLPADSPEWQLIQCIHELFITANELDFKPSLWRWFSTPMYKKAMKLYEHHENLTKYFIKKGKEQLKIKSDGEKGVLEKLLEINEEMAYLMASDMLFAGVDTAANTVTATLYLLATNPEKQEKLREEIMSNSERRPYLRACVKESLRVMPVASGSSRKTTQEYNILGYKIPKNMVVIFCHRDMSLMQKNYPRPREYIPERWITDKDDPLYYGNTHPFAYSPFGFGVRSCIGRRIAELEMDTFVARLIENFKVEWFGPPPEIHQAVLNYVKGPYNFVFKDVLK